MDQPFESEVMEELAAETPLSSAEEFEEFEGMEGEGFEESLSDEMGGFAEDYAENGFEDGFEEEFEDGFEGDLGEDYFNEFEEAEELEDLEEPARDEAGQRRRRLGRGRRRLEQRQRRQRRPPSGTGKRAKVAAGQVGLKKEEEQLFIEKPEQHGVKTMYQSFETDVMDDPFYGPEGSSRMRRSSNGGYSEFDAYDDYDAYEGFDTYEDYGYDEYEESDPLDEMVEVMADALGAEDSDEFLRRLVKGVRRVAGATRQVGRGIGRVAKTVAPIASAIPLPWTQAIGRVAGVVGRVAGANGEVPSPGNNEFEAFDELVDLAEDEDLLDAAAPAIAALAAHAAAPKVARLPKATRRQIVQATTQAAKKLAGQQGARAVKALPAAVSTAARVVRQQGLPPRALPQAIRRVSQRLSHNPQMLRRLTHNQAVHQQHCPTCGRSLPQMRRATV